MKNAIDSAGRVVIPKALRDSLGLHSGRRVEIRERDGHIEIEAASSPMTLVRRGRRVAARAARGIAPLTDEAVRETIERTRR
jgi:AbrB family looped-hinge helix DNA binding protein